MKNPGNREIIGRFLETTAERAAQAVTLSATQEAQFSVHFCVAAALTGHRLGANTFTEDVLCDPRIISLMSKLEVVAEQGRKMLDCAVDITLTSGQEIRAETRLSRGHPGNPLSREELEEKFCSLVEPAHGARARELISVIKNFDDAGSLQSMCALRTSTTCKFEGRPSPLAT